MLTRCLMCIVVIMTLATAHGLSFVPPQFAGPADAFDEADFPGLIILHIHSDGELHIHFHLLGNHSFFLGPPRPLSRPAPPVVAPARGADVLLPLRFNVGTEPLAGALLFLAGLVLVVNLRARYGIVVGPAGLCLPPPDPPPQTYRSRST